MSTTYFPMTGRNLKPWLEPTVATYRFLVSGYGQIRKLKSFATPSLSWPQSALKRAVAGSRQTEKTNNENKKERKYLPAQFCRNKRTVRQFGHYLANKGPNFVFNFFRAAVEGVIAHRVKNRCLGDELVFVIRKCTATNQFDQPVFDRREDEPYWRIIRPKYVS